MNVLINDVNVVFMPWGCCAGFAGGQLQLAAWQFGADTSHTRDPALNYEDAARPRGGVLWVCLLLQL